MKKYTFLLFSSCSKEEKSFPQLPPRPVQSTQQPSTFNLVADDWVKNSDNTYINVYKDFVSEKNLTGKTVSVYVIFPDTDVKIPIHNYPLPCFGGRLWSDITSNDLNIHFQNDDGLPFDRLEIEVTVN